MLLSYFVPADALWLEAGFFINCMWLAASVLGGMVVYIGVLLAIGMRPAELRLTPPRDNPLT